MVPTKEEAVCRRLRHRIHKTNGGYIPRLGPTTTTGAVTIITVGEVTGRLLIPGGRNTILGQLGLQVDLLE